MLSARLLQIAMMIEKNKVVFDVGSDHALLPCFLIENRICEKVYAGEIAKGPYERVRQTISRRHLEGKVIPVFSDGLEKAPDDVDVIVIAGMGYHTIVHILEQCDVSRYKYFILQSNTDVDLLRKYLSDHFYTIEDERIVYDGFYYQVIRFSADLHDPYSPLEISYGPILLKRRDEVFLSYLDAEYHKLKKINECANRSDFAEKMKEMEKIMYNKSM